ncbi:MAG: hypothetical protein IJM71_02415 [Clostridia bacterium]|nr:hypothetical protein [Clostridia bacterium]
MLEKLQEKIDRIINRILEKPVEDISKEEFEMLTSEYGKLKAERDSKEHNKKFAETLANLMQ